MKHAFVAVAALLVTAAPALAQSPAKPPVCRMGLVAELPVTFENNQPTVPVKINGQPLTALLDTGATKSVLFRSTADRLHLKLREVGVAVGVDGRTKTYAAQVGSLTFMGASTPPVEMFVSSVSARTGGIDMLIGRDLLAHTDIELDLGHGKMRLMRPDHCDEGEMAYWAQSYSEVRILPSVAGEFRIGVRLNGVYLDAIIDSGAQHSAVAESLAFRGDVVLAPPVATEMMTGIAGNALPTRRGVVKSLQIGDEKLANVPLSFIPMHLQDSRYAAPIEMLLGADFLKAHRVFISQGTEKIYFTYNGGPIFRADPAPAKAPEAAAAAPSKVEGPK